MLTGDKLETAISISLSCHLFTHHTKLMIIRENDLADGTHVVSEALAIKATEANRINAEELQQGHRWDPNLGHNTVCNIMQVLPNSNAMRH